MKPVFLISILLLSGCANIQEQQQREQGYAQCRAITPWVNSAQCLDMIARNDPSNQNPYSQELLVYRRVLINNVLTKKMTNDEAQYTYIQKVNEVNQSLGQQRAAVAASSPVIYAQPPMQYQRPVKTNCSMIGNQISCNSAPTGPDLSVFQRIQ